MLNQMIRKQIHAALVALTVLSFGLSTSSCENKKAEDSNVQTNAERVASEQEIQAVGSVITGYYGPAFAITMENDREIIETFTNTLLNDSQQSDIKRFTEVLLPKGPTDPEFQTYVIQEFSVMTTTFHKVFAKAAIQGGTEMVEPELQFIGTQRLK